MNEDQKLVAFMGLALVAIVAFTVYRPYLSAVLLGSPAGSKLSTGSSGTPNAGSAISNATKPFGLSPAPVATKVIPGFLNSLVGTHLP